MDRGTVALLFNTTKKILQSSCASKLSTAAHTAWGTKTAPSSPVANLTAVVQRRSKSLRGGFAPRVSSPDSFWGGGHSKLQSIEE